MEGQVGLAPPDAPTPYQPPLSKLQKILIKKRMGEWNTATGINPQGGTDTASLGH